jgi:hypothetical protein
VVEFREDEMVVGLFYGSRKRTEEAFLCKSTSRFLRVTSPRHWGKGYLVIDVDLLTRG